MAEFPPFSAVICRHVMKIKSGEDRVTVIAASGSVTQSDEETFLDLIGQISQANVHRVLLDLGDVRHLDSGGAGIIIIGYKMLDEKQKRFAVAQPKGTVEMILDEYDMAYLFPIFPTYPKKLHW